MEKRKIQPEMKIAEAVKTWPQLQKAFKALNLNCPRCQGAAHESIAYVARTHGQTPEQLVAFLEKYLRQNRK